MFDMKYLVVEIREAHNEGTKVESYQILEDAQKEYEKAKKDSRNLGVYLTAILKEIDL